MPVRLLFAALLALIPTSLAFAQSDLTADEIIDRALDTNTIGFQTGEVTMSLIIQDPSGESRERRLVVRGMQEGELNRALVRVVDPPSQAGQSYLFRENDGSEDDVWVYLPALDDAPRRIAGSQKNGSFMGTHFTYADFESRDIREATYERLDDDTIGPFAVWVVDAVPTAAADSEYARIRMWVRQSDDIPLRVRFFGDDGEVERTIFTEETAEADDGRIYVRRLTLRPTEGGATTMVIESADFGVDVAAAEFTASELTR